MEHYLTEKSKREADIGQKGKTTSHRKQKTTSPECDIPHCEFFSIGFTFNRFIIIYLQKSRVEFSLQVGLWDCFCFRSQTWDTE